MTYKSFHQGNWKHSLCTLYTLGDIYLSWKTLQSETQIESLFHHVSVELTRFLGSIFCFIFVQHHINKHMPFSCYQKLFNNYSQDRELVMTPLFTLQFCYMSYIGVMFEFHSCPLAISHVIFSKILWWLLKTLFSEKTLALSFEELLEVEKEFELYPAKTVIKVNYYCLQLCSLILPVSVHLDNIHKDRMHIKRHSIRGCKKNQNK